MTLEGGSESRRARTGRHGDGVVAFGTYDVQAHPRVAVLIEGLRAHGVHVHEVNARLGLDTAQRVAMLQRPWRLYLLVGALLRAWFSLARRSLGLAPDVVLVGYLGHFDVVLARLRWPRRTIVLDHLVSAAQTAEDRGEAGGLKLRALQLVDRLALSCADVIVVDTEESAARARRSTSRRIVVVPVGATQGWFHPTRTRAAAGPLTVLFFGLFTPLQGAVTIAEAMAQVGLDIIRLTMVGDGQDRAAAQHLLHGRSDVEWRDWVTPSELPRLVADHDVCLGIFGTSEKATSVVPTKVYQGAAAGCALVTSDTAPQRRALQDAALFVPPGDAERLSAALQDLAGHRQEVRRLQEAASHRAADFTPRMVVTPLVEVLGETDSLLEGAARRNL